MLEECIQPHCSCKKRLETYFELERPLPKGKNEKVIELMKIGLCGQIMTKIVGLRAKIYSYLKDNNKEDKKAKCKKKVRYKIKT